MEIGASNEQDIDPSRFSGDYTRPSITMSIHNAVIRLMDATEVVGLLSHTFLRPDIPRAKLVGRLIDCFDDDPSQQELVRAPVRELLALDDTLLAASQKRSLDYLIRRLVSFLPPEEQMGFVPALLLHRRKSRRNAGIRIVADHPHYAPSSLKEAALQAFQQTKDESVLDPLTRIAADIRDVVPLLLGNLQRTAARARVFEQLFRLDPERAFSLAQEYPTEFVWGAGRAQYQNALAQVIQITDATKRAYDDATQSLYHKLEHPAEGGHMERMDALSDLRMAKNVLAERLGLSIWALGQFGARTELARLAQEFEIDWIHPNP